MPVGAAAFPLLSTLIYTVSVLSLVLPTFNEAQNISTLLTTIEAAFSDIEHEVIIVDDNSPDGTWKVATTLAKDFPSVRVIRRVGRRGLSSAVVEGFDAARGDILMVMDADGQHDPELLHSLATTISQGADIAIGSRYVTGGSVGEWVRDRRIISRIGTFLALSLSRVRVSDPLGGFFALKRSTYAAARPSLKPTGFKILLEILAHIPETSVVREIPLIFRMRLHGTSKLSLAVHIHFLLQILRLMLLKFWRALLHCSWPLFVALSIVLAILLLPRVWALRLLYTNPNLRSNVQATLLKVSNHQGWLLSNVDLLSVDPTELHVRYRDRYRGSHDDFLCTLSMNSSESQCDPPS